MRTTAAVALALLLFAGPVWAISVQEVIDLAKAQVGDDIIIAKIKSDRSTFTLGAKDILDLKNAGLSDKVILAMIEAERPPQGTPSPAAAPQPSPTYAQEPSRSGDDGYRAPRQSAPRTRTYEVIVPVYRTVYYPSSTYSSGGCCSYPTRSYGSCGSYGTYPYRFYGYGWYPSYGFSYSHYGRHHSWGVHFGW